MRKISLCLLLFIVGSCNIKYYPHKGTYPTPPFVYNSEKSFEQVWDNIIDFFAQRGISISLIDKSSGLIVSEKTKMKWSREDKKTNVIRNKEAWVVVDDYYNPGTKKYLPPSSVVGTWNIRVKAAGTGSTINVNLHDLQAYILEYTKAGSSYEVPGKGYTPQTTGVFEKMIYDIIK